MKQIILGFLLVTLMLIAFSCKKQMPQQDTIFGSWVSSTVGENQTLQFTNDGSCIVKTESGIQVGSFSIKDNKISLYFVTFDAKNIHKGSYILDKDTLQINWTSTESYTNDGKLKSKVDEKVTVLYKRETSTK